MPKAIKTKQKPAKAGRPKDEIQTEMTDEELVELINKYTNYHHRVWKSYESLSASWDDLYLVVAEAAVVGRKNYMKSEVKAASIRTYIIRTIRNQIEKYRRRQYVRQVKHRMARIKGYCTPAEGFDSRPDGAKSLDVMLRKKINR